MDNYNDYDPHLDLWGKWDHSILVAFWAAVLLVLVAVVIGFFALLTGRKHRIRAHGAAGSWFVSLLWALPVVAVLAFVCVQVTPRFHGALKSVAAPAGAEQIGWFDRPSDSSPPVMPQMPHISHMAAKEPPAKPTPAAKVHDDSKTPAESPSPPAWIGVPRRDDGDVAYVVVKSDPRLTAPESEDQALSQAASLLKEDLHVTYPNSGRWNFPVAVIRDHAISKRYVETVNRNLRIHGKGEPTPLYVTHLQVEVSPRVREKVYPYWREANVTQRLWVLGSLVGLLTLITGTITAYFRLDTRTGGAYRNRLKFAAVSLIVSGGLLLAMMA